MSSALEDAYARLSDIMSTGSAQTAYDEMHGARGRQRNKFYQDLENERKKRMQFTVSIPKQNYQNQSIEAMKQIMGNGLTPSGKWLYPLKGDLRTTSPFGSRTHPISGKHSNHTGIDWAAKQGTPIYAPGDATVRSTDFNKIYGNRTILDFGGGLSSMFGHQSGYVVQPGQRVKAGQLIGYVGSTGNSTGPHLHFETWVNNTPVNPLSWFM
jgi:murein DD-endopeptidase MepM/ murein hydrolase activator NlpD